MYGGPEVHFPDIAWASIIVLSQSCLMSPLESSSEENNVITREKIWNKQRCLTGDFNNTISMGEALSYPVYILIH